MISATRAPALLLLIVAFIASGCEKTTAPARDAALRDGLRDGLLDAHAGDGDAAAPSDADGAASADGDGASEGSAAFNRRSLELSGPGSGYLEVPTAASFTGASFDHLTISAWTKRHAGADAQSTPLVTFDSLGTFSTQLLLMWSLQGGQWSLTLRVPTSVVHAVVAEPERWHHAVGVYDGPSATIRLYLDGQLVASAKAPAAMTMKNALWIGRYQTARTDGWIDEVAFFRGALDDRTVAALYAGGRPFDLTVDRGDYAASSSLAGYFRMGDDDGALASSITDRAGTANASVVGVLSWSTDVPLP